MLRRLAACAAVAFATAGPGVAAPRAACVATGVLATLAPNQAVPQIVGPTLSAANREGTTFDAASDPATAFKVAHVDLGVAGCVDGTAAPGGTSLNARTWSVLGGAIRGPSLDSDLVPVSGAGAGWHLRARHDGLVVEGTLTDVPVGQDVPVGNWGFLQAQITVDAGRDEPLRWWRAALALRLVRAYDGLAAGTTLLIGWVSADRQPGAPPAPPPPPPPKAKPRPVTTTTTTTTTTTPEPPPKPKSKPRKKKHKPRGYHPTHDPIRVTPPLAPRTYDFPVSGRVAWGDTYGGMRSDVPGGWHHGDDLFADLGTPAVAVADGTVFAVGWEHVGGWRLWLRTDAGDAFYYAHLSGYTALAKNNHRVRRGQVLGFVGNTGDAFTTEPHLHFEVHPNELLYLGYDGAVDPTTYLAGWHRLDSVKAPPPVPLPSDAGRGHGAISDFRKLLAIRPLARAPERTKPPPVKPRRIQQQAVATVHSDGGGSGPIVAGVVLLLLVAGAVGLAARNGRSS